MADIVRTEATERLEAAALLTAPVHADRVERLRAEAAVLPRFLDGTVTTPALPSPAPAEISEP